MDIFHCKICKIKKEVNKKCICKQCNYKEPHKIENPFIEYIVEMFEEREDYTKKETESFKSYKEAEDYYFHLMNTCKYEYVRLFERKILLTTTESKKRKL